MQFPLLQHSYILLDYLLYKHNDHVPLQKAQIQDHHIEEYFLPETKHRIPGQIFHGRSQKYQFQVS